MSSVDHLIRLCPSTSQRAHEIVPHLRIDLDQAPSGPGEEHPLKTLDDLAGRVGSMKLFDVAVEWADAVQIASGWPPVVLDAQDLRVSKPAVAAHVNAISSSL